MSAKENSIFRKEFLEFNDLNEQETPNKNTKNKNYIDHSSPLNLNIEPTPELIIEKIESKANYNLESSQSTPTKTEEKDPNINFKAESLAQLSEEN